MPIPAATLGIGDSAPALSINTWVKGSGPNEYAAGRVYVLEFWAMGSAACRKTAPLLGELQALYRDKALSVIGISVMEPGGQGSVDAFVKRAGDRMGYAVGYDATGDAARRFMQPSGQHSIPVAFVIDRAGRIAWIGHPGDGIERVIDRVVMGTWDLDKARADHSRTADAERKAHPLVSRMEEEFSSNQTDKALATMDELAALDPDWAVTKFGYLLLQRKDATRAYAYAATAADGPVKDSPDALKAIAWMTLAEPGVERRDVALAARLARRADDLTKHSDPGVLDTLARAMFDSGDAPGAIDAQKRAVEVCLLPSQKQELQQRLRQYTAAKK
jgi:thiol-disulfide isomerase/thioredoxin